MHIWLQSVTISLSMKYQLAQALYSSRQKKVMLGFGDIFLLKNGDKLVNNKNDTCIYIFFNSPRVLVGPRQMIAPKLYRSILLSLCIYMTLLVTTTCLGPTS